MTHHEQIAQRIAEAIITAVYGRQPGAQTMRYEPSPSHLAIARMRIASARSRMRRAVGNLNTRQLAVPQEAIDVLHDLDVAAEELTQYAQDQEPPTTQPSPLESSADAAGEHDIDARMAEAYGRDQRDGIDGRPEHEASANPDIDY